MPATTIKLDADLAEKARLLMPKGASVSSFVRDLIEKESLERRLRDASAAYQDFLAKNPEELESLQVWEAAPLDSDCTGDLK
jgi:hypothetical protein